MSKPRVSVVILAYNQENYIRQTLEGAVNQSTSFPYEIWVHDDASTDGTPEIIKEFQARYPHMIKPWLQTENQYQQGVKPLTKFIYPQLTSDYVAFCEGDDYWVSPHKLSEQVAFLDQHPDYGLCAHGVKVIFEEGVPVKENFYTVPRSGSFSFDFLDEMKNHFVSTPTLMARRTLVQEAPKNKTQVSGDIYLMLYLLSRGKGYYFEDQWVVKRRNTG